MFTKIYEYIKNFIKENYKFLIVLLFLIFIFYHEFPYIIYKSGGTIDLKDRILIDKDYEENGSIRMSYVRAMKGTIPFIALSYIMPDWDLYSLNEVSNEDSFEEVLKIGKVLLNEGIDNAIIAAFNESEYNLEITNRKYFVIYKTDFSNTDLVIGDELVGVNDKDVSSVEELTEYINTLKSGDTVKIKVLNNNKSYERYATIYEDEDKLLKIGVVFKTRFEYKTEIPVSIKMNNDESGSSGTFMMSLAIYNALTKEDITKGLKIVGTGTIESNGTVGEIGGVKYKVLAAAKEKADVFFCPKENYEEAIKTKNNRNLNIEIVEVNTLKDAIEYLKNK